MNNKDLIQINDSEGNVLDFEIVSIYQIENSDYNYIIYRSLDEQDYYIAKYKGSNIVDLDTNLNEKELEIGNKILEGVLK